MQKKLSKSKAPNAEQTDSPLSSESPGIEENAEPQELDLPSGTADTTGSENETPLS